ncbi:MAG: tetratricopeptide repeat-containing protein [Pseudomonadota bacterium]
MSNQDTADRIKKLMDQGKYDVSLEQIEAELGRLARLTDVEKERENNSPVSVGKHKIKYYVRLQQLKAISLARTGNVESAYGILSDLEEQGHDDPETLGPLARTAMDLYDRTGDLEHLRHSRDTYKRSFDRSVENRAPDYYVGINTAAKSVFLNDTETTEKYADEVENIVGKRVWRPSKKYNYWHAATVAEVQLIKKQFNKAGGLYQKAVEYFPDEVGSHSTTWLQARRLLTAMRALPEEQNVVWQAFRHLRDASPDPSVLAPPYRRLRVYAFDPSLAAQFDMATVNNLTLEVRWETGKLSDDEGGDYRGKDGNSSLNHGPIGEYIEVIDYDPASDCFYEPVNLDDPRLLATDGLAPSEGSPQFHQQMVYAVAMSVIDRFEVALGRPALWSSRLVTNESGKGFSEEFVQRLRIYPHALREANAYYSPDKKALLFGYFPADRAEPHTATGNVVFTCLSHDIIAHEVSHALLDGLHPRFAEPTNDDVLAFHEAFADIVALFQHFSHADVLEDEIARTRGDLNSENLLVALAQQFGKATGCRGALRDAIGEQDDKTHEWKPRKPNPLDYSEKRGPHERGAILVAAIFDAFLTIYRARIADLVRIASGGSGILRKGALHPDLVVRLASEAAKTARHFVQLCIRGLDYCPPVDITFGDYLRAIITADVDIVPNDDWSYRLAIIEAFERRGIYPHDVRNLSVESLVWRPPRQEEFDIKSLFSDSEEDEALKPEWRPAANRQELWSKMRENEDQVKRWLTRLCTPLQADELGLNLSADAPRSLVFEGGRPAVEVHSVRVARRTKRDGEQMTDLVVEILQSRRGYLSEERQQKIERRKRRLPDREEGDFTMRGGCTLLIDPATSRVRYAITKHILSGSRLSQQRTYLGGEDSSLRALYFGNANEKRDEPFALLHRDMEA